MQTYVIMGSVIIVALSALWVIMKITKALTAIAIVVLLGAGVAGYFYGVPYVKSNLPVWRAGVVDYCKSILAK